MITLASGPQKVAVVDRWLMFGCHLDSKNPK